jgi:predicted metal-dependent peptidase
MPADDPFAAVEAAARQQVQEEAAALAVSRARASLVLGKAATHAFFATLALRLRPEPDGSCPTAATDGKRLVYNPAWFAGLPADQAQGVVAHEVLHCALAHHARRQHRDPTRWNIACDLAINPLLRDAGLPLPAGGLFPGEGTYRDLPTGQAAEAYYALLPSDPPGSKAPDSPGKGDDPGGCGGVCDPGDGSEAAAAQSAAEWEVAVAQAQQVAQQRGRLPVGLGRCVAEALQPRVDWRDVLREFVAQTARNDYAWSPPNRRFIHRGLYLPGLRSEELGAVVLAVDTSGSIGRQQLDQFASEAQGILDAYDCTLSIVYHDSEVQRVDTWRPSDGPLKLQPVGGGGTDHRPVFDWIDREGLSPACVVCLTDLYTDFPAQVPARPVLWAVVGRNPSQPPFGRRVEVKP